ncbi:Uncharacterised protein [Serratia fonticola]|uniref:Uncharacterized protein n=1 Tax=Serratia fonticola TaxID=47917 RepID=A0A4U9W7X7_SERFO|nr:Uncharacterised protein [Serratia fonticola]
MSMHIQAPYQLLFAENHEHRPYYRLIYSTNMVGSLMRSFLTSCLIC